MIMRQILLLCFLLSVTLAITGCVSTLHAIEPGAGNLSDQISPVQVNFISQDGDWSFSRGCFWTVRFQVYNKGDMGVKNVQLHIELTNADTGTIRDTRDIYVGTLAPGTSVPVAVELDGECTNDYNVRGIPSYEG